MNSRGDLQIRFAEKLRNRFNPSEFFVVSSGEESRQHLYSESLPYLRNLQRKLTIPEKYTNDGRKVQDVIGLRVVLYFSDDIPIVQEMLCQKFSEERASSTIDKPTASEFTVTRWNLVFNLPNEYQRAFALAVDELPVDSTFEIQLRTILSEGWHEVEHDLRYKKQSHWDGHDDLGRSLNGLVATLETAEWGMRKILDDLAYRQYRSKGWDAMLHSALRMRVEAELAPSISALLDRDNNLAKAILRINRAKILRSMYALAPRMPVTLNNVVYLWNYIGVGDESISAITPTVLRESFQEAGLVMKSNPL